MMSKMICRLCLNDAKLIDIFDSLLTNSEQLRKCVLLCTGVQICPDDLVTKYICQSCSDIAIFLYKYRINALANDKALKQEFANQYVVEPSSRTSDIAKFNSDIVNTLSEDYLNGSSAYKTPEKSKKPTVTKLAVHPTIMQLYKVCPKLKIPKTILKCDIQPTIILDVSEVENWIPPPRREPTPKPVSVMERFKKRCPTVNIMKISHSTAGDDHQHVKPIESVSSIVNMKKRKLSESSSVERLSEPPGRTFSESPSTRIFSESPTIKKFAESPSTKKFSELLSTRKSSVSPSTRKLSESPSTILKKKKFCEKTISPESEGTKGFDLKSKESDVRVSDFQARIKLFETKIKNFEPKVKVHESKVKIFENKIKEPEVQVKKPEVKVKEPEVKVKKPEAKVKEPEAKVKKPEVKVKEPESRLSGTESKIKQVEVKAKPNESRTATPESIGKAKKRSHPHTDRESSLHLPKLKIKIGKPTQVEKPKISGRMHSTESSSSKESHSVPTTPINVERSRSNSRASEFIEVPPPPRIIAPQPLHQLNLMPVLTNNQSYESDSERIAPKKLNRSNLFDSDTEQSDNESIGANDTFNESLLDTVEEEISLHCVLCNKLFSSEFQLKCHERCHRKCTICNVVFRSADALRVHHTEVCFKTVTANSPNIVLTRVDEIPSMIHLYPNAFAPEELDVTENLINNDLSDQTPIDRTAENSNVFCISDDDDDDDDDDVVVVQDNVEESIDYTLTNNVEFKHVCTVFSKYKDVKFPTFKKCRYTEIKPQVQVRYNQKNQIILESMYPELKSYRVPVELMSKPNCFAYVSFSKKVSEDNDIYCWANEPVIMLSEKPSVLRLRASPTVANLIPPTLTTLESAVVPPSRASVSDNSNDNDGDFTIIIPDTDVVPLIVSESAIEAMSLANNTSPSSPVLSTILTSKVVENAKAPTPPALPTPLTSKVVKNNQTPLSPLLPIALTCTENINVLNTPAVPGTSKLAENNKPSLPIVDSIMTNSSTPAKAVPVMNNINSGLLKSYLQDKPPPPYSPPAYSLTDEIIDLIDDAIPSTSSVVQQPISNVPKDNGFALRVKTPWELNKI